MDFTPILPGALLTLGLLGVLVVDLIVRGKNPTLTVLITIVTLLSAGLAALAIDTSTDVVLGVLRVDALTQVFTVLFCVVGALTVIAGLRGEAYQKPGGELLVLILAATLGMAFLSASIDLVMLYLAFETVSIPSYVLVGMRRADPNANEASMKYVLFGAVSSAMMLYGLSFIVGITGGTSLEAIGAALANGAAEQPIFIVAALLTFAGFAFKISAFPFHFWAPDVYAGAPAAIGGFLAVASKAAGFAGLIRVISAINVHEVPALEFGSALDAVFPETNAFIVILAVSAVLTMTVGNLGALKSRGIKRLLAWSGIAHAGYLMLACVVWSVAGLQALLFYLVAYLFMTLAAFFIAGIVIRDTGSDRLTAFRGLWRNNPGLAAMMVIILISLTGLPPFFGFVAKYHVFYAVFEKGYFWLGIIGLLNGVISLFYYARVVAYMFLDDLEEGERAPRVHLAIVDRVFVAAMTVPVLVFGLFWEPIWNWARDAVAGSALYFGA